MGLRRSHAYHRKAERALELWGAIAADADRVLTFYGATDGSDAELVPLPNPPPELVAAFSFEQVALLGIITE